MSPVAFGGHIEIRRPRREVFGFVADPLHLPAWRANLRRVAPDGSGPGFTMDATVLGRRFPLAYERSSVEAAERLVAAATSRNLRWLESCHFEGDHARTRLRVEVEAEPGGRLGRLGPVLRLVMARRLRADLRRLRATLEGPGGSGDAPGRSGDAPGRSGDGVKGGVRPG